MNDNNATHTIATAVCTYARTPFAAPFKSLLRVQGRLLLRMSLVAELIIIIIILIVIQTTIFGSIDPHHNNQPKTPRTINLDAGDDCPPHKRPPKRRSFIRGGRGGGVIIKGGKLHRDATHNTITK